MNPEWSADRLVPLVRELRTEHGAPVVYLERGWLHGPHVDVVARPGPFGPLPWKALASRAAAPPAGGREPLTERAYLAQARELGRLEQVDPPYLPMAPHGTVRLVPAAQAHPGWPERVRPLRELALSRMTAPVVHCLESLARDPGSALVRMAEAFAALAGAHPYGVPHGTFSFRSHAEAFFHWAGPGKDPRAAFGRRLDAERAVLRPVVERALTGGESATAAQWRAALSYGCGLFEASAVHGETTPALLDSLAGAQPDAGPDAGRATARSAFHTAVADAGVTDTGAPWFLAYRLVINLFYRQLPLFGVSPMMRYYLCHAVAETVDEITGVTWQERLAARTTHRPEAAA
ncbi:hypothetical protein EF912_19055 [Streptomyces sp. WAC07061]|uniref:hypothetical protein n=1 Tax=Streptomyces sp. WAC07061 TaxID=2487410 RepID=UPI000F77443A|nr:hypothetical protein [Streptomyces sp. WAC07061]RSS52880.1 hypothetical protein EF912_19055 [Streptomyces sp. WAC07061]